MLLTTNVCHFFKYYKVPSEQLLLAIHLSTSHIVLGNAGHFEVEQGLILQFEHIAPNEQPIQP